MKIAVAGGGLAGLVAALRLRDDHDVTVFEREAHPGGKIRSQSLDGFLFEWGPNGFMSSAPELREVVHDCGLEHAVVPADAAARKRYVYFGGTLHALPSNPREALGLTLLSAGGKLRALGGLLARRPVSEESVYDFFARRFGSQVAERVVRPALLGITAGEARATSMDALFPRMRELERVHGSLLKGLTHARGAPARLSTLAGGMSQLIDGLTTALGTRVERSCEVLRIERDGSRWRLEHARGAGDFDAVLLAIPAYAAARILRAVDGELEALLEGIPYAPMRVCGIAFRSRDVPAALDGFGFLAARDQGVRILGALYTSTLFPQQAPPNSAYLRVFLGGTTDARAMDLTEPEALAAICRDLAITLGIAAEPIAFHDHLWPRAIPQYALGHLALLQRIDVRLASLPRLVLTGNAYRGVGVADVVRDARSQVDRLVNRGNE